MKLLVFGANGRVGKLVVKQALSSGHTVTAAVHNSNPFNQSERLQTAQVDVFDSERILSVVENTDAVISCLGSWGTESKDILTRGMRNIIPAMEEHAVKRIVSLTGSAAFAPGDNPNLIDKINRHLLRIVAAPIVDDGEQHIQLLEDSPLDWTVVRSPVMNNFGQSDYELTNNSPLPTQSINRQAIANALVNLVESDKHLKQAPFIKRS